MRDLLLDEHMPRWIRVELRRRDARVTIWRVGDEGAPPCGTADPDILRWLEKRGYVLVTNNRKTMPVHVAAHLAAGGHVPGVLMVRPEAETGPLLRDLLFIASASGASQYADSIVWVPFNP